MPGKLERHGVAALSQLDPTGRDPHSISIDPQLGPHGITLETDHVGSGQVQIPGAPASEGLPLGAEALGRHELDEELRHRTPQLAHQLVRPPLPNPSSADEPRARDVMDLHQPHDGAPLLSDVPRDHQARTQAAAQVQGAGRTGRVFRALPGLSQTRVHVLAAEDVVVGKQLGGLGPQGIGPGLTLGEGVVCAREVQNGHHVGGLSRGRGQHEGQEHEGEAGAENATQVDLRWVARPRVGERDWAAPHQKRPELGA